MRQIHIKFELPFNWYAIRKLGLYFHNLPKQAIMPGQCREFSIDVDQQSLQLKLDFFKSQILIPKGEEDIYVTIAIKGENSVGWVLNSFTRSGLSPKICSKAIFDAFDQYYSMTTERIKEIDYPSFAMTTGVIAYLLYTVINSNFIPEGESQLIWATVVIGIVTLFVLWKDRYKISRFTYKSRIIVNSLLLFAVMTYLSLQGFLAMGWLVALIPLSILFRTLSFENNRIGLIRD